MWVALAGGLGAASRLIVDGLARGWFGDRLPWGTLLINVLGSAGLGWIFAHGDAALLAVAGTGFLGGFTTFSTASFETARLALEQRWSAALGYGVGTLAMCVSAAAAALTLG